MFWMGLFSEVEGGIGHHQSVKVYIAVRQYQGIWLQVYEGAKLMIAMEKRLEAGKEIEDLMPEMPRDVPTDIGPQSVSHQWSYGL